MPKAPDVPPPPAQRQAMKAPESKAPGMVDDPMRRRRGYAALMSMGAPSLNPVTTSTLGG
jgi:hypothetical protein